MVEWNVESDRKASGDAVGKGGQRRRQDGERKKFVSTRAGAARSVSTLG